MKLTESWEDYLETILILKNRQDFVRSIDIANEMDFSKASVSRAVGNLKDAKLIVVGDDGGIEFTERGKKKAKAVYEKHVFIQCFLVHIGVDEKTAAKDACRVEHAITEQTFEKLKDFVANYWPEELKEAISQYE